ncbi:MAG: NADPH-dependent assimilatory sulfite reductase hemoprotein subunit [Verrucomicrobia bacterium]|nr:NADPH-dependent assimilatory sulfite reductase hemoprotein subunit [Verrucomicrobiota bacterium]NBU07686.1 NADPH-dependent assimilatory sulfite reductase hemoprotein subunit [Pseudomonadota bacterium]NDA66171.1 NADPH-dependent assimilatory sulfite reductase hemoprotein subunit [Verrucomicrobiota bacterium]NDB74878.1 NADPH-dependent assimilatory sulfite reductase hemoprotein subunit [Verrucomicrobiota bacterium]NDD37979.1 NADPH-dependent assimilatory sulfite reductase hemoprotein subunit [Ver
MITTEPPAKLTHNEVIKEAIPTLAGNIAATVASGTDQFSADDQQFIKFHGIYQQDDRDARKVGKKFIMMVRGRIPGGVMTPAQWIAFDDLASNYANNTLRITTRQSIQFHGIVMSGLGPLIKRINDCLLSTLAACGDVNRNVMASPAPAQNAARAAMIADVHRVVAALAPQTKAYHAIWLDGVQLNLDDPANKDFVDPLYGKTYLPRKFKTAFVLPPVNDMDVFTNDLGFIGIVENGQLVGYNLTVGGGMGRSHGNSVTYPRLADVFGFIKPSQVVDVAKAVLTVHRDFGDRTDRKHARLKYVVAERGVDFVRNEIEKRAGLKLEPARKFAFTTTADDYGWHRAIDGTNFLTLFVECGRVKDADDHRMKTALRRVAEKFGGIEFRLTGNQNVILANVADADKAAVTALLAEHGVRTEKQASLLHSNSMACPALPTCGLALAESERALPGLIDRIEKLCGDLGLGAEEIVIRSTGCPNGCARPYMAEIGFVGKAPGRYQLWLGGNASGTRLNQLFKDVIKEAELENELRPLLARFATERTAGERFGDWCDRVLLKEQPSAAN